MTSCRIQKVEVDNDIPREIIRDRIAHAATHLVLNKNLISDAAIIRKLPTATAHREVTNYCKRVAHPFTSLCAQHFRLDTTCLLVLFKAMQTMKMCLRTSFVMPGRFYTGEEEQPFQEVVQDNAAAPPL